MRTPVEVKLGRDVKRGFYSQDVEKDYTEIQEGKMPHAVLQILSEGMIEHLGISEYILSERVSERLDYLSTDEYGQLKTLPSLLKDFESGKLVTYKKGGKVIITKLGKEFLNHNVISE